MPIYVSRSPGDRYGVGWGRGAVILGWPEQWGWAHLAEILGSRSDKH